MAKKRSWLPIVAGIAVLLVFLVIAGLVVMVAVVRDRVDIDRTQTESSAQVEFDRIRAQFTDPSPMLEFDGETPRLSDEARRRQHEGRLGSVAVLAWNPREGELVRLSLPFWLLRLQGKPFKIGDVVSGLDADALTLTAEDIERFGPGILLDYEDDRRGARVLVWTQ
jgi:hypothetical protein